MTTAVAHRPRWDRKNNNVARAISPQQRTFITEYMKDRNAVLAYERAGYKGGRHNAHALLNAPHIAGEVNRLMEEYAVAAGIKRVELLEKLKTRLEIRYRDFFRPGGGILPPDQWPEDADDLVTGYNAGTVTAAEKITFKDKIAMIFDLLNEIRPVGQRKGDIPPANVLVFDLPGLVDKLRARSAEIRGTVIDVTPGS